ncbi:suppressor of fused domain protein [Amycolatopsis sp. NPDC004378]
MGLIEHLEERLGPLTGGWRRDGFQVGAYAGAFGAKWFATAGLSRHPLHSPRSGRHLWLELVAGSYPGEFAEGLPHLLGQVADEVIASGRPLLRGDVLGPRGPFTPGSAMEALYAASPVYFDDAFAAVDVDDGNRAAIVWLVPISAGEAAYVASHGWKAFEDELIRLDPDLLDPGRAGLPPA